MKTYPDTDVSGGAPFLSRALNSRRPTIRTIQKFSLLVVAALAARALALEIPAVPTPQEIDAQYASVLSAMKSPLATGVLVTELGPASPAGASGLHAGDIIIKLNAKETRTLQALREQVAELIAANFAEHRPIKAPLVVRRATVLSGSGAQMQPAGVGGDETLTLEIPPEPMGIRAIEVQAGVAAPLNPPVSPRGTIKLAWKELRDLQHNGGDLGHDTFFRNFETDGTWLGWQKRSAQAIADETLSGTHDVYHLDVAEKEATVARSEAITFTLHTGDYANTPAFVLDSVEVATKEPGAAYKSSATRAGNLFRLDLQIPVDARTVREFKTQRECPLSAIVPSAIPLVAAAMPQQKDAVIPLQLMSVRDFIARPGYVLAARGKQKLPTDDLAVESHDNPGEAWRVDLMHCGTIIESDWFSDDRRLVRVDSFSGTTLIARRVNSERDARSSAEENPFRNIRRHPPATTAP